jgi:TetR/AcrR family transcriptional repressor of nem operon
LADKIQSTPADSSRPRGLRGAIADYLSTEHKDDLFGSCPFVALGSELARGSDGVRPAATAGLLKLVDAIEGKLKGQPSAAAQKEALLMLSTMVGALTLA